MDNAIALGKSSATEDVRILAAADVLDTLAAATDTVSATILDPWYNKGVGGTRPDYDDWLREVIHAAAEISDHVFVWGFPEIVAHSTRAAAARLQVGTAWLTWYYKNCPSVIRGWRPGAECVSASIVRRREDLPGEFPERRAVGAVAVRQDAVCAGSSERDRSAAQCRDLWERKNRLGIPRRNRYP